MKDFDQIDRYLNGEMETNEKAAFETAMQNDMKLAETVELQKAENQALDNVAFDLLKSHVQNLDQQHAKVVSMEPRRNYLRIISIAASVVLLLTIGYLLIRQNPIDNKEIVDVPETEQTEPTIKENTNDLPEKEEQIAETENEKPEIKEIKPAPIPAPDYAGIAMANTNSDFMPALRGDALDKIEDETWRNILDQFAKKKFDDLLVSIDALPEAHPFYMDAKHLKAKSLFLKGAYDQSVKEFEKLISEGDEFLLPNYEYEMLLSLTAQLPAEKEAWIKLYEKINADEEHTFRPDANKLKQTLIKSGFQF